MPHNNIKSLWFAIKHFCNFLFVIEMCQSCSDMEIYNLLMSLIIFIIVLCVVYEEETNCWFTDVCCGTFCV